MHYIIFTKLCWWLVNLTACLVILISSFFVSNHSSSHCMEQTICCGNGEPTVSEVID